MAEDRIEANDLISKEAIQAPLEMSKNVDKDAKSVDALIAEIRKLNTELDKSKGSLNTVKTLTTQLAESEKKLVDVQKNLNKALKEASDHTKSMSKGLGDLSKVEQDINTLTGATSGFIARLKDLWGALMNLAKNPFFLALAGIVGAFVALKSAASAYYKETLDGQDRLRVEEAKNRAFFASYKSFWAELGESVALEWENMVEKWKMVLRVIQPDELTKRQFAAEFAAGENQRELNRLQREHVRDVVDDGRTEVLVNELIEKSKNKLLNTDKERLGFAREAKKLLIDQLEGDIKLAEDDLAVQRKIAKQISEQKKGTFDATKSLADLSDAELKATKLNFEEIEALKKAEIAYFKTKADGIQRIIAIEKIEQNVHNEIAGEDEKRKAKEKKEFEEQEKHRREASARVLALMKMEIIEQVNLEKKAAKDSADLKLRGVQFEILAIQEQVRQRIITKQEGDAKIKQLEKDNVDDLIQIQIDYVRRVLQIQNLSQAERAKMEEELYKLQVALNNALYDQVEPSKIQKLASGLDKIRQIYEEFTYSIQNLYDSFTQSRVKALDIEQDKIRQRYETEIELAGDNKAEIKKIQQEQKQAEARIAAERREALTKQAIADKAAALFDAGLKEAILILDALIVGPRQALRIAAAIAGGIQVAAVAAKPIPKFYKGVRGFEGGPAIVGDQGAELYREPGKGWNISPGKSTLVNLDPGSDVLTHDQTIRALSSISNMVDRPGEGEGSVGEKLDRLNRTIERKKFADVNITSEGLEFLVRSHENKTRVLTRLFKGC